MWINYPFSDRDTEEKHVSNILTDVDNIRLEEKE